MPRNRIREAEPGPMLLRKFVVDQIEKFDLKHSNQFPKAQKVYSLPQMELLFSKYGGDWKQKFRQKYAKIKQEELEKLGCK